MKKLRKDTGSSSDNPKTPLMASPQRNYNSEEAEQSLEVAPTWTIETVPKEIIGLIVQYLTLPELLKLREFLIFTNKLNELGKDYKWENISNWYNSLETYQKIRHQAGLRLLFQNNKLEKMSSVNQSQKKKELRKIIKATKALTNYQPKDAGVRSLINIDINRWLMQKAPMLLLLAMKICKR